MVLKKQSEQFSKWGIKEFPHFRTLPPSDINELVQIFVGRDEEIDRAILTLDRGENILVIGMTGIGKTAFIMATLHQIEVQNKELGNSVLTIHVKSFNGKISEDFYHTILYHLALALSSKNKRAKEILDNLIGMDISQNDSRAFSTGGEFEIPHIVKLKIDGSTTEGETYSLDLKHLEHYVEELIGIAFSKRKYKRIIFAIDGMEMQQNQYAVNSMLECCLDIIRDKRCSFIFTAKPSTVLEGINSSSAGLGIYESCIHLQPFSEDQLRQIAIRTLNMVRATPQDSVYPFTEEVIRVISKRTVGIPRHFALLCASILSLAIKNSADQIDLNSFNYLLEKLKDERADEEYAVEIYCFLDLARRNDGFISVSRSDHVKEANKALGTTNRLELMNVIDRLVDLNLMQRYQDVNGDVLYKLVPGTEKLALKGSGLNNSGMTRVS